MATGSNGVSWGFVQYSDVSAGNTTIVIPNGATGARPSSPVRGQVYFDSTLGKPVWYSGSNWVDATGTTA